MNTANIIIPEGRLAINLNYGRKVLKNYLHELDLISSGCKLDDLGMSERRAASKPTMIEVNNDRKPFFKDKIAVVKLNGLIRAEDGLSSYGTRYVGEQLMEMKREVIGALFIINSGGGYMDGAEAMIFAMREFGKPIVTLSGYSGSAAMMIASESNKIYAETEMSEFGSIGVYIELSKDFKEMYKEYVEVAYSDDSPQKNKSFRDWIEKDDLSGFVKTATEADKYFMNLIKKNRNLTAETKEETLAGGMFYADDAEKRGLIDGINTKEQSILTIQKLSRL